MIFITGPLYSGKRTFAKTLPGRCICDVQELAAGAENLEKLADELSAYDIVLATEVGGGVVPMDPAERAGREAAGRLACLLAVALTACAGGGEPPAPSGSPASAPLEALKEPANSMSVSPPLSPAPVSAEALAAYRALLAGEPGALDRPPEGLELHQVTLPPAEELEYVLLDLDGDGGAELVVQMVEQPQQFNAVFHYGDGELSCWQYDIVEMSCRDYPLEDGAMVRQYDTGTGPNRYSNLYTVFRYLPDGETEECASLAVHQDTQEDGTEVFTYLVDDAEVDQDTFAAEFEELVGSRLLSLEDWTPATERPG